MKYHFTSEEYFIGKYCEEKKEYVKNDYYELRDRIDSIAYRITNLPPATPATNLTTETPVAPVPSAAHTDDDKPVSPVSPVSPDVKKPVDSMSESDPQALLNLLCEEDEV